MRKMVCGLVALGGLTAGCVAPLPVVRLMPHDKNVTWVAGLAVTERSEGGVRAAVAFERQDGHGIGFRVEVQNDAPAPVVIDPRDMVFVTCATQANCSPRETVVDPEEMLLALDHARSREQAQGQSAAAAGTALLFLAITADVAAISKGHNRHAGERTALAGINLSEAATASEQRIANIDAARAAWSSSTLRRTTLPTGRGAAGLVYVRLDEEAHYVWLDVRAGAHDFWFPFEQAIVPQPRRHRGDEGDQAEN